MASRQPMTPEDLFELNFVDRVALSPDGKRIVYEVRTVDRDEDGYQTHLWIVPASGGEPRRLTQGAHHNGGAAWSPDGQWLAFVSNRQDKKSQVYRLPLAGGEAERLTDLDGEIGGLAWSPDGSGISFVYRPADPPEHGHLPGSPQAKKALEAKEQKKEPKPPTFMRIDRLFYKLDGHGWLPKEFFHLHVLDVATRSVRQLTFGDWNHDPGVWSPDGKWLAFSANRLPDADWHLPSTDIWVIPGGGGEPRCLTPQPGPAHHPSWSPDGRHIAFLGQTDENDWWGVRNEHVWVVPLTGGAARDVMPDFDRMAMGLMGTDLNDAHGVAAPVWSRDGATIYFTGSDQGATHVYSVPVSGGTPRPLTRGRIHVMDLVDARGSDALAVIRCGHTDPGTVGVLDPATGEIHALAAPNAKILDRLHVGDPEEYWVQAPLGHRIQCWLLKPPRANPSKRHPMILEVHGGPRIQYGHCFFHEFQMLAAAGFYVLFTNPRGAQGYGEEFTKSIVCNWGAPAFDDLMLAVDETLRLHPEIDPDRLGVTGGSYGGYMTNWIVGHTDRFKAALTQRSVVNLTSLMLGGDFSGGSTIEFGAEPWAMNDDYRRLSPLTYVENIRTPLLITHSMEDHRCPLIEGEMLYTALKLLKREVELVLFPGESHGLSRGGTPSRRLARLHVMRDWFVKHLAPESPAATVPGAAAAEPALSRAK
jgi:dipeptidyl aminopeptidase/acylaminoacyl peptidase